MHTYTATLLQDRRCSCVSAHCAAGHACSRYQQPPLRPSAHVPQPEAQNGLVIHRLSKAWLARRRTHHRTLPPAQLVQRRARLQLPLQPMLLVPVGFTVTYQHKLCSVHCHCACYLPCPLHNGMSKRRAVARGTQIGWLPTSSTASAAGWWPSICKGKHMGCKIRHQAPAQ